MLASGLNAIGCHSEVDALIWVIFRKTKILVSKIILCNVITVYKEKRTAQKRTVISVALLCTIWYNVVTSVDRQVHSKHSTFGLWKGGVGTV